MKRKTTAFVLAGALLAAAVLSGCAEQRRPGTADNEVLSLTEIPADKMMLTMRISDGMNYEALEQTIETQFPNVDIVVCSNTALGQSIAQHDTEDIMLLVEGRYAAEDLAASFIDLSPESFVQNYYLSSLQQNEVDGKLYYLPGPSNIYGIVYNKDMFREHGWSVPDSLDSFLALCVEIEQTGIRAIQPSLYYKDAARQFFTGFTYSAVLGGADNAKWHSDYKAGNAVMAGHMEPAFDILDRLIEAGVVRSGDFDVLPFERSDMMYKEQSCAMILETQAAPTYAQARAGDAAPELGLFPFFSGADEDSGYFLSVPIYSFAISKRLEEPGNEEKLATAKQILAYLSTPEGQMSTTGESVSVISSVKGVELQNNALLESAAATIEKGHVVPQPFFVNVSSIETQQVLLRDLEQYVAGEIDRSQFMADMDQSRDSALQNEKAVQTISIGTAEENFTILETSLLMAQVFQEKTGAQIGLCPSNTTKPGNNWKIYQGEIEYGRTDTIDYSLDLSFPHIEEDENKLEEKLVLTRMTGAGILQALETFYARRDSYANAYMVASGLKITFAPWAGEGQRFVSVKLADGSDLEADTLYTVAFWNGSVDPALINAVEAEYEDTAAELLKEWVAAQGGSIRPDSKNFTLDWTITEGSSD